MVAGFDRYYQITAFRDEDLRATASPSSPRSTRNLVPGRGRSADVRGHDPQRLQARHRRRPAQSFPRMTYTRAMRLYGSDKPDLRVTLSSPKVTDAEDVDFGCSAVRPMRRTAAVWQRLRRRRDDARRDRRLHPVRRHLRRQGPWPGSRSTTSRKLNDEGLQSPIVKNPRPTRAPRRSSSAAARQRRPDLLRRRQVPRSSTTPRRLRIKIGHSRV